MICIPRRNCDRKGDKPSLAHQGAHAMADWSYRVRTRNLYDPGSPKPFRISRSKIDLFLKCPRCFYQDRRLGVPRPAGFPFNLNSLVDTLLKREFDHYRKLRQPHPLMKQHGVDAIPFDHPKLDQWRDALRRGVKHHDQATNLVITGGIDDVWINPSEELIVVDYKATAKTARSRLMRRGRLPTSGRSRSTSGSSARRDFGSATLATSYTAMGIPAGIRSTAESISR